MSTPRSTLANDPLLFGRRVRVVPDVQVDAEPTTIGEDLRLFAITFAAGFLFISIFLG